MTMHQHRDATDNQLHLNHPTPDPIVSLNDLFKVVFRIRLNRCASLIEDSFLGAFPTMPGTWAVNFQSVYYFETEQDISTLNKEES